MDRPKVGKPGLELRAVALPLACVLIAFGLSAAFTAPGFIPRYYVLHQDGFVVAGLAALLLLFCVPGLAAAVPRLPQVTLTMRTVLIGAVLVALLLWAATYWLFRDYPLSRDEQMVVFDMQIFRHGELAAPLAPEWRHYANALTPAFLLPLPDNAAWVSSYMPVNAIFRTLGGLIDPALTGPVLAAIGAVATFDCARRLFPEQRGAQGIALLIYATSAQVLVTAMTPYAMTGHLALNMMWLALYLRGSRWAHAAAMAIGFLAIGLHQVVFHPLFALPFIEHLRRRGEWRTALAYVVSYSIFGLFWISWPHLVAMSAGLSSFSGASTFIGRALPLLTSHEPQTIALMIANLLRFVTWENLALLPLMLLAWPAVRRGDGIAAPLLGGVILTIAAMAFILPYQAMGWGYRYLHGLIGSCALLAGYGWREAAERRGVRAFVTAATAVTVLGCIPFLTWQATAFVRPYARVNQMIDAVGADMVVVNSYGPAFRIDEVRNHPDLSNRPLRFAANKLTPADIALLCSRGTVAFVDVAQMQALGLGFGDVPDPAPFNALRDAAPERCRR
ncbi:MAG: hypothetical protein HOP95_05080 [Sphingomonas sp.]|nr:hypothetical protein [Sphingomonas sp.]